MFVEQLRKHLQHTDLACIREVPQLKRLEVPVSDVPVDVQEEILAGSPACTTVRVGMFSRKGMEFLSYQGWGGTSDGFPIVTVRI